MCILKIPNGNTCNILDHYDAWKDVPRMHVKADHYLHASETAFKWHSFRWRADSGPRLHADWVLVFIKL